MNKIFTKKYKICKENCGHPDQQQYLYRCYRRKNGYLMTVAYVSEVYISGTFTEVAGICLHCYVTDLEVIEALVLDIIATYQDSGLEYVAVDSYIYDCIPIFERLGFTTHVYDNDVRILALAELPQKAKTSQD